MATTNPKGPKPVSLSRKSARKRDAIVRAAIETINAKSYALATMKDIAAALDLQDATLYHYFPDKRTLAYTCHRRSLEFYKQLLLTTDQAGGTGAEKIRRFVRGMLVDSARNGQQLYFGDYSYLNAPQRKVVAACADRLKAILVKFMEEGMADGTVVQCEPELVVQLLLGMLIWLAKWAPAVEGITVDRLMTAIDAFCFRGLDRGLPPSPKTRPSQGLRYQGRGDPTVEIYASEEKQHESSRVSASR
jgi:AcrR family transcriptional regulator